MAYIIYNNDGSILTTIADGDVDSLATSLDLIGKNVNNYGQYFNQNLVRILNSFAAETGNEPRSPQPGQLWFNKTTKRLTVYDGSAFKPTYGATISGTEPSSTSTGDLWYDTANSQLKLWNGTTFKLIAPQVSSIYGKFGIEPPVELIEDQTTGDPAKVGFLFTHGKAVALVTTGTFVMSGTDATLYLDLPPSSATVTIRNGLTAIGNLDVVSGDFYINNQKQIPPEKCLTAYADITYFGDPTGTDLAPLDAPNFELVKNRIQTANVHIREKILDVMFSTSSYYGSFAHPFSAEAKVVCYFNTETSIRHFHITSYSNVPGGEFPYWKPNDIYPTVFDTVSGPETTTTNIIPIPL